MSGDLRLHLALPPVSPAPQSTPVSAATRGETRLFEPAEHRARTSEAKGEDKPAPSKGLVDLVEELSDLVQAVRRELRFSVDEESGLTVIRVVDSETGELVRQIPPEEIVNLVGRFKEGHAGLIKEQA